jgi:hypothetical protein
VRRIRIAAYLSAVVGLGAAVPFNLRFPRTPGEWYQVALGLMLVALSLAVAAHLRLARRALVLLLWLAALLCGLGLVFCGVMAWTTGEWPGPHGWNLLLAAIAAYYGVGAALFGGLYLFFHSERVVQAYGS